MTSNEEWAHRFRGIFPAVVTPFNAEGEFAAESFEQLLARLYGAGVHGIYVCGQTGEGILQPVSMRQQVAETAVRCTPKGQTVILHVGAARLADAIHLARHAERIGAAAVSSLPPAGNYSFVELRSYYQQLAEATSLPLLVYYYPEASRLTVTLEHLLDLCSIPNVAGLKFTDFDLYKLHQISQSGKVIFNGRDEVLAAGLLMGAGGGIGTFYNLVPELFLKIYESARSGKWNEARQAQDQVNELIRITLQFPMLSAVKTMLKWQGFDCGKCLAPRQNLTQEQEIQLRGMIESSSLSPSLAGVR
ncbi:MAG: dihydrodipicolinate synthase family protein [Acidobacteria bacterium]|nr:MAG: dihydrodipicolinate synthase family protein [Acidobacteriota bacterium]